MKNTKKLFSAVLMLALSTVMLATSSFAWFSMNEKVTATNMNVTAVGDQIYLQISNNDSFTAGTLQTSAEAADTSSHELLPSTVVKEIDTSDSKKTVDYVSGGTFTFVTNISDGEVGGLGAYLPSGAYSEAVNGTNEYYLKNSFYFRLDSNAGAEESNSGLKVNSITLDVTNATDQDFAKCLSVFVVNPTTKAGAIYTQGNSGFEIAPTELSGKVTDSASVQLDVYIFFDGENENCNLAELYAAGEAQYNIAIEFTCK